MRINTLFLSIVGLVLGLFVMLTPLHAENDLTTQRLEPIGGTLKWAYDTQGTLVSAPAIRDDGTIYVTSGANKRLYAITPDGTLDWYFDGFSDSVFTHPAIADDGTILRENSRYLTQYQDKSHYPQKSQ